MRTQIPYDPRHTERVPATEREEINNLLRQMLSDYNATNEDIQKLSIDCISNLTTAKALSHELSEQGYLKRTLFDFIGRNQKLQRAVNQSYSHSMYATQQLLILLMEQNKSAMEFSLHLDQKQQMINLDFSEQLSQQNQDIHRICKVLQRLDLEMNETVRECRNCRSFLRRDSVICPHCGKMRTQTHDLLNTDSARNAYQADLDALSEAVSRKAPASDDPIRAAVDFARLCDLSEHLQDQLDAMYTDTTVKIDTLKLSRIHLLQRFQKDKLSQRDAYRTRFLQELRSVIQNEKDLIDETLDQFDHLDHQTAQLMPAISNLKAQCGGA